MILVEIENNKIWFFLNFKVILVEIKDNKIVTKMEPYYYFPEIVDIL